MLQDRLKTTQQALSGFNANPISEERKMKHTRDEAKFLKLRQVIITNTYYIKCG
jgi:hypothetical protein